MAVDPSSWNLPVRKLPQYERDNYAVLWNNAALAYNQLLFGQCTTIAYSPCGKYLAASATNQHTVLRVPQRDGCLWNEQVARQVFSTRFRDDSKLLLECVDRRVSVRSTETAFARHFDGHTRDVRDAIFLTHQMMASCSDDGTVRFWDMARDTELAQSAAHGDYVRSLDRVSESVVMTGGYDKHVRVWDVRVSLETPVGSVTLQKQVERVLYIGQRQMGVAAAADVLTLFDLRATSNSKSARRTGESKPEQTVIASLSVHSKAISGLAYSAAHDTLVSAGLDGRVKFLSLLSTSFDVDATRKFQHPVTCVSVHPESDEFAVGMSDGSLSVFKLTAPTVRARESAIATSKREVEVLESRLTQIRKLLSVYQYHRALRVAMFSSNADVIATTLEELQRRCALHVALSGHNDRAATHILRFAVSHLETPATHDVCLAVINLIFEIYGSAASSSPFFHRELLRAHKRLGDTVVRLETVQRTIGSLELVLDDYGSDNRIV